MVGLRLRADRLCLGHWTRRAALGPAKAAKDRNGLKATNPRASEFVVVSPWPPRKRCHPMSTPRARVLTTFFLAFLLGASILAVQPAGAFPVSGPQQDATTARYGADAPFGSWQTRVETNRIYIDSDKTNGAEGTLPTASDGSPPAAQLTMDVPRETLEGSACQDPI